MYKVFYLAKEIIFTQNLKGLMLSEIDTVVETEDKEFISSEYNRLLNENISQGRIIFLSAKSADYIFQLFKELFENINAAGGLVINLQASLLMIYRFGIWDLPKGKIEKAETPELAALREVSEETGLNGLKIISKLQPTYHLYQVNNKRILKKTFWYEMSCADRESPVPQTEEGIMAVKWMNKEEVKNVLNTTYKSLLDMLELYLQK